MKASWSTCRQRWVSDHSIFVMIKHSTANHLYIHVCINILCADTHQNQNGCLFFFSCAVFDSEQWHVQARAVGRQMLHFSHLRQAGSCWGMLCVQCLTDIPVQKIKRKRTKWEELDKFKCLEAKCREKPWKVRARTYGTKSPSRSEALRFIDSAKSPSTRTFQGFSRHLASRHLNLSSSSHVLLCCTQANSSHFKELNPWSLVRTVCFLYLVYEVLLCLSTFEYYWLL